MKNNVAAVRKWRHANPEKVREYKRRYAAKHGDKIRTRMNKYYAKNRDKILEQHKESWQRNKVHRTATRQASRAAEPERYRNYQRKHKRENPASWRLYNSRKSARKYGVICTLDVAWFQEKLAAGVCELSGIPFDGGKRTPNSASVDRINPTGPYTKENCRMIIWWLNRALTNLGEEYAFEVFRAIFKKRGEIADYEDRMAA